jgi:hypothetical protein
MRNVPGLISFSLPKQRSQITPIRGLHRFRRKGKEDATTEAQKKKGEGRRLGQTSQPDSRQSFSFLALLLHTLLALLLRPFLSLFSYPCNP